MDAHFDDDDDDSVICSAAYSQLISLYAGLLINLIMKHEHFA